MKIIQLTQGKVAHVSDKDYAQLSQFKWYAFKKPDRDVWYARRWTSSRPVYIFMHRDILGIHDPKVEADHKDGDGLNNQRRNLRIATSAENRRNGRTRKDNKSGVRGVSWYKRDSKWRALIKVHGKEILIGYFKNLTDAAHARRRAEIKYHGRFSAIKSRGQLQPQPLTQTLRDLS